MDKQLPPVIKIPRQTKFLGIPDEMVDDYLKQIENAFDSEWLSQAGSHRIRTLWERSDGNSTIELVSLGYAIKSLSKDNKGWLGDCISDVRSDDRNRQNGALFELNIIAWLIEGGMTVIPASHGEKGIDLTLKFPNVKDLFVSLKNYDISNHEQRLQANCERIRNKVRSVFRARGYRGISSILTAPSFIDSEAIWREIEKTIEGSPDLATAMEYSVGEGVRLFLCPVSDPSFADGFISDNFAAMIPYHKNEQANFIQKVNDAVIALKSKCADRDGKKSCFIRIHQTADIAQLSKYAEHLINKPDCAADLIVLYQPAFLNDQNLQTTTPSFCFSFIPARSFISRKYPIRMQMRIGQMKTKPGKLKLIWPDGSLRDLPPEHYCYCAGQHFLQTRSDGSINFTRRPGLSVYPVFSGNVVAGILPPDDEFLVL